MFDVIIGPCISGEQIFNLYKAENSINRVILLLPQRRMNNMFKGVIEVSIYYRE